MKRLIIAAVTVACSVTAGTIPVQRAQAAPAGAPRVTLIGDSTMAAMRWYGRGDDINQVIGNSYDLLFDAESCRRLVATSCRGRIDPVTGERTTPLSLLPLIQGPLRGQLGQVLVVMTGYDDTSVESAIDAIMNEAQNQRVSRVMWLTYRTSTTYGYGPYYEAHNAALSAAQVRWPSLEVLDWDGYTRSLPADTQTAWFTPDDIHMTRTGAFGLSNYIKNNLDGRPVGRCQAANALTGAPAQIGAPAAADSPAAGFVGLAPVRLLDTREAAMGGAAGMLGAGRSVEVSLGATFPAAATGAVLSVSVNRPCANGYLTVYDCGPLPLVSSFNYATMRTTTNTTVARPANGKVCVYSSAATEVIVDLVGAFVPGGQRFTPITPVRWTDTRGVGVVSLPVAALVNDQQVDIPVAGVGGIPSDATGVALSATAISTGLGGFVTLYPGPCSTAPLAATVAVHPGRASTSDTFVALGSNGGICAKVGGGSPVNISLVMKGWFGGGASMDFVATSPSRLFDTRAGAGAPVSAGGQVRTPAATTLLLNVAGVRPTAPGALTAIGCGGTSAGPQVNVYANEAYAAAAVVGPGATGELCFGASVAQHIVVDSVGRFVPASP
jgi:hypothetical protein